MSICERALRSVGAVQTIPAFRVEPVHLGAPIPGRSYDRISTLLDEVEGAEHPVKLLDANVLLYAYNVDSPSRGRSSLA
jgi:hypothetical protein